MMSLYQMGQNWKKPPSFWFPEMSPLGRLSLDFHVLQYGKKQEQSLHDANAQRGKSIPRR